MKSRTPSSPAGPSGPIIIGLGANLPTEAYGPPKSTCEAALAELDAMAEISVAASANWYESAPVPVSDQPWYVNGAARLETELGPADLLVRLLEVESRFGRVRAEPNAPRILDLDLLAYGDAAIDGNIQVPHPRLHERAFALLPLRDLAPDWTHPVIGLSVRQLVDALPPAELNENAIRII